MTTPPLSPAQLADLARQGWTLESAEDLFAAGDGIYWLPSAWDRSHPDEWADPPVAAKVPFLIRNTGVEAAGEHGEFMWVELLSQDGLVFHGVLTNTPHTPGALKEGQHVNFGPGHIMDLADATGRKASDGAELIRCGTHGLSEVCYVCEHLSQGTGLGFITGDDSPSARPDAWCHRCNALVSHLTSWDDLPEADQPRIVLVCGGCYDAIKVRNSPPGLTGT